MCVYYFIMLFFGFFFFNEFSEFRLGFFRVIGFLFLVFCYVWVSDFWISGGKIFIRRYELSRRRIDDFREVEEVFSVVLNKFYFFLIIIEFIFLSFSLIFNCIFCICLLLGYYIKRNFFMLIFYIVFILSILFLKCFICFVVDCV